MTFTDLFYKHIMFRHSCGKCHYCNTKRPSDITIADFWGWEKTNPEINKDNKGISLILVNTEKGRELFNHINKDLNVFDVELENALQPNLKSPSVIHKQRNLFEKLYSMFGYNKTMILLGFKGPFLYVRKLNSRIKRYIKKIVKR